MGLFSSRSSSGATRRSSSDAQLREMRSRARRRLIGALVLVLAAVLIVPFLTSNEPEPEQSQLIAVIPPPSASGMANGQTPAQLPEQSMYDATSSTEDGASADDFATVLGEEDGSAGIVTDTAPNATEPEPEQVAVTPVEPPRTEPQQPKPEPQKEPTKVEPPKTTTQPPKREPQRTDDGAVALALLEGRVPPSSERSAPAAQQGNFILQIVAYSAESEAQSRRNQLVSAGVTNAYVEAANSGGKPTYRLRVGPFPTREAAQAAQTRLRSLGYENSFISTK